MSVGNEQQLLLGAITTLGGVVIGYLLATFNDKIKRNRLRYCLLKQFWGDLAKPREGIPLGASTLVMPHRLSIIDAIISSGVLGDDKRYYTLMEKMLILRGWYINFNALAEVVNSYYIAHDDNSGYSQHVDIMTRRIAEHTEGIREEIKKLYHGIRWE